MDSLELLNVLDVIKNEEVYTKRLNQLKEHQAKLDTSKYIVSTVEQAQEISERAQEREDKAKKLVDKLEADLKKVRSEIEAEYKEKYEEITRRAKSAAIREQDAKAALNQAIEIRAKNEIRTQELKDWEKIVAQIERNAKEVETIYTSKINRIKEIIQE